MTEYIVKVTGLVPDAIYESAVEEIVRCRDCKHYVEDPQPIDPGWPMMCDESGRDMVPPDGFCAWACRKGEDE